jgi:hypothetical protein
VEPVEHRHVRDRRKYERDSGESERYSLVFRRANACRRQAQLKLIRRMLRRNFANTGWALAATNSTARISHARLLDRGIAGRSSSRNNLTVGLAAGLLKSNRPGELAGVKAGFASAR